MESDYPRANLEGLITEALLRFVEEETKGLVEALNEIDAIQDKSHIFMHACACRACKTRVVVIEAIQKFKGGRDE